MLSDDTSTNLLTPPPLLDFEPYLVRWLPIESQIVIEALQL